MKGRTRMGVAFAVIALSGCAPKARDGVGDDADLGECMDGEHRCANGAYHVCQGGRFVVEAECSDECVETLGCVACVPGATSCTGSGLEAYACRPDGSGWDPFDCDPLQGLFCNFDTRTCDGACAPANLAPSNTGCNYFPTVTGNEVRSEFEFAVIVSNDGNDVASVHIEDGALASPITFDVAPHAVHVQRLPWVDKLKACKKFVEIECDNPQNLSALVKRGAYHLRSTRPVSVYQYNPLDYKLPASPCNESVTESVTEGCSYSNDASLLLPASSLTGNYYAAAWHTWPSMSTGGGEPRPDWPGFVAITATRDNTLVTITPSSDTSGGLGIPNMGLDTPTTITLDQGDVAQLFSQPRRLGIELTDPGDLTGTRIVATQPVQVIGGHYCTESIGMACDHMEESMLPVETLGTRYIVTAPEGVPHGTIFTGSFTISERYVRIVATEPDITITYDPPTFRLPPGQTAPTHLANAGDFVEIPYALFRDSVEIRADKKILVAEYMVGGQQSNTGDPSMAIAVPIDQYRSQYSFHAPTNYDKNYVNIVAPLTSKVYLDGAGPLAGFEPIGTSGWGLLRAPLVNSGNGTHEVRSVDPIGITVYGYGAYTSYWYAGGLDLRRVVL